MDPSALQDLGSQLDSPAVAKGFARDYTRMWDQRYQSLATSLDSGDETAALDAVLSLKTSSAMVGGVRLAELARELEDAIRVHDARPARGCSCVKSRRVETTPWTNCSSGTTSGIS